jgi:mannose-6-phosphate isomerase
MTKVQLLPANQVEHFYRGGDRIAALRGGPGGPYRPEEWIGSVTPLAGQTNRGLSRLADGTSLRDAILADPRGWLGPAHLDSFGTSTELLVKLLDAGERLPVHAHPDRAFAAAHLGLPHGKTEAWVVLEADEGARVRLGFTQSMSPAQVRAMVDAQDSDALVGSLRSHAVRPGDAVLVPAGLPHYIDAGLLVLELQEPTDLSILLEWSGFAISGRRDGHLGLGFDVALSALRLDALDPAELERLVVPGETLAGDLASLLPEAADPFFRAHRVRSPDVSPPVDAGFAIALVTAGAGTLVTEAQERVQLRRGDAAVIPWSAGKWQLDGPIEAMICRPPAPHAQAAPAAGSGTQS